VSFEVLAVETVMVAVVWNMTPCSLVDVCKSSRGICCLHLQESVTLYQITWCPIPENSSLHCHCLEGLKMLHGFIWLWIASIEDPLWILFFFDLEDGGSIFL
jgi:hypothetical protein